jgi:hypothetical protein
MGTAFISGRPDRWREQAGLIPEQDPGLAANLQTGCFGTANPSNPANRYDPGFIRERQALGGQTDHPAEADGHFQLLQHLKMLVFSSDFRPGAAAILKILQVHKEGVIFDSLFGPDIGLHNSGKNGRGSRRH